MNYLNLVFANVFLLIILTVLLSWYKIFGLNELLWEYKARSAGTKSIEKAIVRAFRDAYSKYKG
jgi:hypothetical protein